MIRAHTILWEEWNAARIRGGWIDIPGCCIFRLSGPDAARYLNGQITRVPPSDPAQKIHACVPTVKGKLVADVFVGAGGDGSFWIDGPGGVRAELGARLGRYLIADDAELADETDSLALLHFLSPLDGVPSVPSGLAGVAVHVAGAARLGRPGLDVLLPRSVAGAFVQDHPSLFLSRECVETIRVGAGIPAWGSELDESVFPAEAGLDRTSVDFHKGCYVGQEVVSRIESVGRVNRLLVHLLSEAPLHPGDILTATDGSAVGSTTSAAWSFDLDKWLALGYVKRDWSAPGTHLIAGTNRDAPGVPVQVRALPDAQSATDQPANPIS